ncbi:MAG: DUF3810 domain-containing protein [Clostridiales bacterium]|nr:DUF3810 domain-containing protein [Clostridiales bacterium]
MPQQRQPLQRKSRKLRWLWVSLVWVLAPAALLGLFQLCKGNQAWINFWVQHITSPIKSGVSWLCAFLPFGVAEVVWAAGVLAVVGFLVRTVYLLVTRKGRLRRLLRRVLALGSAALIVYTGYTLMWGANYYADTFSDLTGLTDRGTNATELYTLLVAFSDRASGLAEEVERDKDGLYIQDLNTLFAQATEVYDGLLEEFPCLTGPDRQPKAMAFSRILSYMGFTGFYFPFTGESMVNVDQPEYLVPFTLLHELSHQRNIASEEECNFLAILAGVQSDNIDFAYSACMAAYIHLSNALYKADADLWADAAAHLSEAARADNRANSLYWAALESPAKAASQSVYSGVAKSYGQEDVLASYGACVDLLAAYYFDYHPDAQFWS